MDDLILVKHAAPEISRSVPPADWVLSAAGRKQSLELADRLTRYAPSSIFCSEEPKAVQTAEIIGLQLELPAIPLSGLQENDRSGVPFFSAEDQFREQMREFFERPDERVLGNESANEAHARFAKTVDQLLASAHPSPTVVVTHGAVLTLLVARANRVSSFLFWSNLAFTSFVVLSTPFLALRHVDLLR
jgi:broad specificity phosphatase PhoE